MKHSDPRLIRYTWIFFLALYCWLASPGYSPGLYGSERAGQIQLPQEDSIRFIRELVFFTELSLTRLKINQPSSGVQFYRDGIIYLFDTKTDMQDIEVSFGSLDTYYAPLDGRRLGHHEIFSNRFAFPFPTESISFTGDEQTMYFTRQNENKAMGWNVSKIYETRYIASSRKRKTGWSENIVELSFNSDDHSCAEPSVSADGNILVFSSNKAGGEGRYDLYMVAKQGDDWGTPVNLGNSINTSGDERFPFLLNPGTLFFCSNGHPGFGGYDIFLAKFDGKKWTEAINLGSAVNSSGNEMSFVMDRDNPERAFFSSTRFEPQRVLKLFDAILVSGVEYLSTRYSSGFMKSVYYADRAVPPAVIETATTAEKGTGDTGPVEKKVQEAVPEKSPPESQPEKSGTIPAGGEKETPVSVTAPTRAPTLTPDRPPTAPAQEKTRDEIKFRVQILASTKSLGDFTVNIEGTEYRCFEYHYSGAYRYTVGEFDRLTPAIEFQKKCRSAGYSEAFIAAFRNNVRTLDKSVFENYR